MERLRGRFNDGVTARTLDVEVRIDNTGLSIIEDDGAELERWPAQEARLAERPSAGRPIRLVRDGEAIARLTISEPDALARIVPYLPDLERRTIERGAIQRWALWGGIGAASLALLVWVVIPLLAAQFAAAIPSSVEQRIGARVAHQLTVFLTPNAATGRKSCVSADGRAALDDLVARLSTHADLPLPVEVRIVNSEMVNAFALPGGYVIVMRGLIDFVENPEEFAGVLAHELGHLAHRDPTEAMFEIAGIGLLFSLLVGDVVGGTFIVALGERLIATSYSRAAERRADDYALRLLRDAGIDQRPVAGFFERLLKLHGKRDTELELLSTHPPSQERADKMRENSSGGAAALTAEQWQAVRGICDTL